MRLPFHGRFERANRFEREQRDLRDRAAGFGEDHAPCYMMEKGDGGAMVIAAMITIVPVCLIVLAILAAAGYFFIMR